MPHYESRPPQQQPSYETDPGRELRGLASLFGAMACSGLAALLANSAVWPAVGLLLLATVAGFSGLWTLVKHRVIDFVAFCCFRLANIGFGLLIGNHFGEPNDFALWEEEFQNG